MVDSARLFFVITDNYAIAASVAVIKPDASSSVLHNLLSHSGRISNSLPS